MFKEFTVNVIALAFLATACEMIIPEGGMKKYFNLFMGFMMMLVLIKPFTFIHDIPRLDLTFDTEMTNEEIEAKSNAYILQKHKENIISYIKESTGCEGEIFVELYSDGKIRSVVIKNADITNDESDRLKEELGCDNIEITGDTE